MTRLDGGFINPGTMAGNRLKTNAEVLRAQLIQESGSRWQIPWTAWRVWDAMHTNLPGTSATDDLAFIGGTFATGSPTIQTSDLKAAGATTRYARCVVALPAEYDDNATVQIRAHAGMKTTISDTTATIDFQAYESDLEEGIGSDLVTTVATTMNSVTLADIDFTLTATTLASGDVLDIRMAVAINDGATVTAVIGMVGNVELLLDVRG